MSSSLVMPPSVQFRCNKNRHITFSITGLDFSGEQEIRRLKYGGYCISDSVEQMFRSTGPDGYGALHRLILRREYSIVLLPGEYLSDKWRTLNNLCEQARRLGYGQPLAGIAPRIREVVTDEQMKEMGFRYIVVPHHPIVLQHNPNVDIAEASHLFSIRLCHRREGIWLGSYRDYPGGSWTPDGAFAFFGE